MRSLLVVLAVMVALVSGCGKKEPPQPVTPPGMGMARPISPQPIDFSKVEEVKPTGELATVVHKDVKPVLEKVFGGAKLTLCFEMGGQMGPQMGGAYGSHLIYAVKRRTELADVRSIEKRMAAQGYKLVLDATKNEIKTLCFEKEIAGKTYAVTIGTTPGDQRVSVVIFPRA